MTVGMHEIAFLDTEPENLDASSEFAHMNKAVTGSYRSGNYWETWLQIAQISHHAIRKCADHSQPFVHSGMNLTPPGGDAFRVIEILDHRYRRTWPCRHGSEVCYSTRPSVFW